MRAAEERVERGLTAFLTSLSTLAISQLFGVWAAAVYVIWIFLITVATAVYALGVKRGQKA